MRVFRTGLLAPHEGADLVREQLQLAHRYRNTLVEIDRRRRTARRAVIEEHGGAAPRTALAAASTELGAALKDARAEKAETRAVKLSPVLAERIALGREVVKERQREFSSTRKEIEADPALLERFDAIEEIAAQQKRDARAASGVYWGTYLLVEAEARQANKVPLYDGAAPNDPHFVRWEGEGRIGVQLQGGLSCVDAWVDDPRFQIALAPPPPKQVLTSKRASRREYVVVSMRVGSNGRAPIWARFRGVMHRELPTGGIIKEATVILRRIGPREEWSLLVAVDERACAPQRSCGTGEVAIDIGWRVVPGGLRVAAWRGSDGANGTLVLDSKLLGGFAKVEDLCAIRSDLLVCIRAKLLERIPVLPVVPAWLAEATATLMRWESPARMAALARRWKDNRFMGDGLLYVWLEEWRHKDHHLWAWETSQRTSSIRARREIYRCFAAGLRARYGTVVVERFDLRKIARRAATEETEELHETARSNRQLAATSSLRLALKGAFVNYVQVSAAKTTRVCAACGHDEVWDQTELRHACPGCGLEWDQDDNAARNLLKRYACECEGDATNPVTARGGEIPLRVLPRVVENGGTEIRESHWSRVKRLAAEKRRKRETAREEGASEVK